MSSVQHTVIKHKISLLNLAAELGNVSRACKVMGFSRDTFYRYQAAVETGGVEALIDANRRKPNIKNRVEEATEAKCVFPMNYANAESSSLHLAFVQCGCAKIWSRSRSVCQLWKSMSPKLGGC